MNAYLMLLEEEEMQLNNAETEEKKGIMKKIAKVISLPFVKVWSLIKRIISGSKNFITSKISKIHPLLRWSSLATLASVATYFISRKLGKLSEYSYFLTGTAVLVVTLIYLVVRWRRKKKAAVEPSIEESILWDSKTKASYINEENETIDTTAAATIDVSMTSDETKTFMQKIYEKIRNFIKNNYEKISSFVGNQISENKVLFFAVVGSILGFLFALVYFKLKNIPIRNIFEMVATFVREHMAVSIGVTIGMLFLGVGIYYFKFAKKK